MVKWVEDRREHLMALSSGAERKAFYELAARRDGTILGVRARHIDNNGAYIRALVHRCLFDSWSLPFNALYLCILSCTPPRVQDTVYVRTL